VVLARHDQHGNLIKTQENKQQLQVLLVNEVLKTMEIGQVEIRHMDNNQDNNLAPKTRKNNI
jgi:hypothetical protein